MRLNETRKNEPTLNERRLDYRREVKTKDGTRPDENGCKELRLDCTKLE